MRKTKTVLHKILYKADWKRVKKEKALRKDLENR